MRKLFSILAATLFATTMFAAVQEFTMTIATSAFNSTSYAANNNEKTTTAVATADPSVTMDVKWTSNQVMLGTGGNAGKIQGQKNAGLIYNAASWGKIKSITINDNSNYTYTIGNAEKPSATAEGGFFQIKAGSATSLCSSIVIVFEADASAATLTAADIELGEVLCEPDGLFVKDLVAQVDATNLTDEIQVATTSTKIDIVTVGNLPATGGELKLKVTAAAGTVLNEAIELSSGTLGFIFYVKGQVFEKFYNPGKAISFDAGEKAQGGDTTFVNGQKAVKVGTSSAAGTAIIHVPAQATKLYFLAAAWANKPCKIALEADDAAVTLDPSAEISLLADAGITGNSPFYTKKGDLSVYQVVIDLNGVTKATDVTVTATSSDKRFVMWDVTCEGVNPPAPGSTVDMTYTIDEGLEWADNTASEGWWDMYVEGAFELSNLDADEAPGTYTVATDLDPDYCYIISVFGDTVGFKSGEVVVAIDANDVVTLKGKLTGDDDVIYDFNLTYDPAAAKYLKDEDTDFTATFASYTVDAEDIEDGIVYIIGQNTSNGQAVVLEAIVDPEATGVIAGTYPINESGNEGTVAAGYLGTSDLMGSYAVILDEEYYILNRWYIVSGNVTVDANLNIAVAAKNSKNRNITITLAGDEPTGINNAKSAKQLFKVIENGQLIIEVDGVRYNVTGIRVK